MANTRGNILNRTSYDAHQEINTKVKGVLKQNNKVRENLLQRNIGFYNMIDTNEGVGYISQLYNNEHRKPFSLGEDGLLGYLHTDTNSIGQEIKKKYNFEDVVSFFRTGASPRNSYLRWGGKFNDYYEFIVYTYF